MGNILSDESRTYLTDNWTVLFNYPLQDGKEYQPEDKEFILEMAKARRNFLSIINNTTFPKDDGLIKAMYVLAQIAKNSQEKEKDFLLFLTENTYISKSDSYNEAINAIESINNTTNDYFDNYLKQGKEIPTIAYNEKYLKIINYLFWGIPIGKKDDIKETMANIQQNDRLAFIEAISALRANDFYSGQIQLTKTDVEDLKVTFGDLIRSTIETTLSKMNSNLSNQQYGSEKLDSFNDLDILKVIIKDMLSMLNTSLSLAIEDALTDIKKKIEKQNQDNIENKTKNDVTIIVRFKEVCKISSENFEETLRLLKKQINIEIQNNKLFNFLVDEVNKEYNKTSKSKKDGKITQKSKKLDINSWITFIIKKLTAYLVRTLSGIDSLSFFSLPALINNITVDIEKYFKSYSPNIDNKSYNRLTDSTEIDTIYNLVKSDLKNQLKKLLDFWVDIIEYQIRELKTQSFSTDIAIKTKKAERAANYFNMYIKNKIKTVIMNDINNDQSDLEGEVLKAVNMYLKGSWNTTGRPGFIGNFNGTISEIFVTYLLKEINSGIGNMSVSQKGAELEGITDEDQKQSVTDIEAIYSRTNNINNGVGMQAKHYKSNKIDLYKKKPPITLYDANRYLTQQEIDSFLFLMGNYPTLKGIGDTIAKDNFEDLLPYLDYRVGGFLRFKNMSLEESLENNFYIINLNILPASILFLIQAQDIIKTHKDLIGNMKKESDEPLFKLEGSIDNNNFIENKKIYYNNFSRNENDKSANLMSKIKTFKVSFKGLTINIDSDDIPISIFKKKD